MKKRINSITVGLPAQAFEVRSHVSVERTVPVMTEFALRLLHILGPTQPELLSSYFGLSPKECRALISLLVSEHLIEDVDDRLSLTSYALARFAASDERTPRFSRIAERVTNPTFELFTFCPLPKSELIADWDNSLPLHDQSDAGILGGRTIDRAHDAYFKHFHDIERFAHDSEERRAIDVYKVDEIVAGRRFNIPYPVHFDINVDGEVAFTYEDSSVPDELRQHISKSTADTMGKMPLVKESIRYFNTAFKDELLSSYTKLSGFEFGRYVSDIHAKTSSSHYADTETKPHFGAMYLPESVSVLVDHFKESADLFRSRHKGLRLTDQTIYWVAPDEHLWGRTSRLKEAVSAFEQAGRTRFSQNFSVALVRPVPKGKKSFELMRQESRAFAAAGFSRTIFANRDEKQRRTEMLVFPGVFATALYHCTVPSTRGISAPLGFSTGNEERLRRAQEVLCSLLQPATSVSIAVDGDGKDPQSVDGTAFSHLTLIPQDVARPQSVEAS